MKLTILALDCPYPPTSGGRVDIWNHLRALKNDGVVVQLVYFSLDAPEPETEKVLDQYVSNWIRCEFESIAANRGRWPNRVVWQLKRQLSLVPSCSSNTALSQVDFQQVVQRIETFSPDAVIAHGIQTMGLLAQLLDSWGALKWFYRSHNHEARYYRNLAQAETALLRKLTFLWQSVRLKLYEKKVLTTCSGVFHISHEEWTYFQERGYQRQHWVPPIFHPRVACVGDIAGTRWTIGILSSWFSSQKIEGLRWFAQSVLPALPKEWTIAVAGSGAPSWLGAWCESNGMTFLGRVRDVDEFYASCDILVNTVRRAAGVNLKTLDMLASGKPVVTTSAGALGLPPVIKDYLHITDDPGEFCTRLTALRRRAPEVFDSRLLEEFSARSFVRKLRSLICPDAA